MSLSIRKRGRFWHARGTVPSRQADGKIGRVRIEESTHVESRIRARKIASDIERYYHELAYNPERKRSPTFAEAALTYIQTRGKSDRFITQLIEHFGETPINEIDQAKAIEAAEHLYPNWSAASRIRGVFTPLSAIGVKGLQRPRVDMRSICIPADAWLDRIIAEPTKNLSALIIFLTLTGRRVGEALALRPQDIDAQGYAHIGKTKTGKPVVVKVPELCMELLEKCEPHERLFGYFTLAGAHTTLKRVCDRLGIPKYGFHAIGRHSFATRALKAGKSIKWVQIAGGWASPAVPMARYLHLEQSEVAREVEKMGREWGRKRRKALKTPRK